MGNMDRFKPVTFNIQTHQWVLDEINRYLNTDWMGFKTKTEVLEYLLRTR